MELLCCQKSYVHFEVDSVVEGGGWVVSLRQALLRKGVGGV